MHAVFFLYGNKKHVDEVIEWLETRVFFLPFKNPKLVETGPRDSSGKLLKEGLYPLAGGLRYGIFGTWEYVFPQKQMDEVLTMLRFSKDAIRTAKPGFWETAKTKAKIYALRKALALEPVPDFKEKNTIYMPQDSMKYVRIIPIGVRYDQLDYQFPDGIIQEAI